MDTKEKILLSALKLFSRDGYEAVSVSMIADELGISKGALYKHYLNKRAIFDSIVQRMDERDYENARRFDMPENLLEGMPERFKNTGLEKLCAYTMAQFVYWTEDEFASRFRKLISLERYRNSEMNSLYQRYFGSGILSYIETIFDGLTSGGLGGINPHTLALEFYAPVYTLISLFDGGGNPGELAAGLKDHMESFVAGLEKRGRVSASLCPAAPAGEDASYPKSRKYSNDTYMSMIMGPNPVKLAEELLEGNLIREGGTVCDLGCGRGLTSLFLAREYGFKVVAADLWNNPEENAAFFESQGFGPDTIKAVKADALALPFAQESFDGIVCIGSYHYFGRDRKYLNDKLLPYVRHGGYIYIAIPGMVKDCHDRLPRELLFSWNPDQLDYMHDVHYWRGIISAARGIDLLAIRQMDSMDEVWQDWLRQDNSYAREDRKAIEAGAGKYLNFIKIVIRKR